MTRSKYPKNSLASALTLARQRMGVSQDEFRLVSSRTYVSDLERGVKRPTIDKVDDLASVLKIHPLTLLTLSYLDLTKKNSATKIAKIVEAELDRILNPLDD